MKKISTKTPTKAHKKTRELLVMLTIVVIVLAVLIVGGGITGAVVGVPTTETYACQETVYEDKIVQENVPLSYSVINSWVSVIPGAAARPESTILNLQVKNNDYVGGSFKATYALRAPHGGTFTYVAEEFIKPYETVTISSGGHQPDILEWSYIITPPTREKLTIKMIEKQVPSTCTRSVEKPLWQAIVS